MKGARKRIIRWGEKKEGTKLELKRREGGWICAGGKGLSGTLALDTPSIALPSCDRVVPYNATSLKAPLRFVQPLMNATLPVILP